ncbi:MAG: hypothetical protein JWP32_1245 [Schumannella sp.]|nr:hypothetical protein [Schumannella sp.]
MPVPRLRRVLACVVAAVVAGPLLSLAVLPVPAANAAQTPSSCAPPVSLVNGSFETPAFFSGVIITDQSNVPGWSTTAGDGQIELWEQSMGVPPGSGNQFAELNANVVSTLYQDLATVPGQTLRWQLQHRGRAGVDVMQVSLGAPAGPLVTQAVMSDGNTAWGTYSGLYTVPVGQTTTRFAFESISSVGGASFGNFLDDASLGTAACVVVTKSVTNVSRGGTDAVAGDVLEYTVDAQNQGGVPATSAVVTDAVPAGTTFVPGSITTSSGPVTDAAGDDSGEFSAGTVTGRIGDGSNAVSGGSIPAGETRTMTFRVTVDAGSFGLTLANEADVAFVEPLTSTPSISVSNSTSTPVLASADLAVSQTLDTPLARGAAAQYTITVTNHGPQDSTDTDLTSTLPAFAGMAANDPDCQITGTQMLCHFGTLAVGASRVVVLTGTVPAGAAGGTSYTLASSVAGSVYDPVQGNNSATTVRRLPSATLAASGSSPEAGLWLTGILLVAGIGAVGSTRIRRSATLGRTGL